MRFDSWAWNSATSRNESTWCSGRISRCTGACGLMSLIATNPCVALTWSPSRTSLQKRQSSCGVGKDPLLADRASAHANEVADRRVDEEGRVVVAVATPGPVDEHDVLRAELRVPAAVL